MNIPHQFVKPRTITALILDYLAQQKNSAWFTTREIAKGINKKPASVQDSITQLMKARYVILKTKPAGRHPHRSYQITPEGIAVLDKITTCDSNENYYLGIPPVLIPERRVTDWLYALLSTTYRELVFTRYEMILLIYFAQDPQLIWLLRQCDLKPLQEGRGYGFKRTISPRTINNALGKAIKELAQKSLLTTKREPGQNSFTCIRQFPSRSSA